MVNEWRKVLTTGLPLETEFRLRRADGEYRWFLTRALPLMDESGNIEKWYCTGIEIEDRKRAEEAVRKTQAELAHVTRVLTMGELTASIAHEINQPLAGIVINGNACLRWLVVLNLMMNGIDAMKIVADRTRSLVIKTESVEPDQVGVTLKDSGTGLDPKSLKRIFDAFYTTKSGGLGMGLSISRSIVENHGGQLQAIPNDGPGTSFEFTLIRYV
jgi:C4-dicarboxylate-specific signal transduction histidine kinase